MANNSNVKKLVQVSEELAPPVQMPVMVGNEWFILTQQDVRRVEDTRILSYNRVTPNAQFGLVTTAFPINNNVGCGLQESMQQKININSNQMVQDQHISNCVPPAAQHYDSSQNSKTVASVATQLEWCKKTDEKLNVRYPRTNNAATSTCGLMTTTACQHSSCAKKCHFGCQTSFHGLTSGGVQRVNTPQNACCQTVAPSVNKACNTSKKHINCKFSDSTSTYNSEESDFMSDEDTVQKDAICWRGYQKYPRNISCDSRRICHLESNPFTPRQCSVQMEHKCLPVITNPGYDDIQILGIQNKKQLDENNAATYKQH